MPERDVPVHPDLDQLRHQAKDLLEAIRRGEPAALGALERNHPRRPDPATARLADAQLALARSYGVASWPRLVQACRIIDAIWEDDVETVRALVTRHPALLHEDARGVPRPGFRQPRGDGPGCGARRPALTDRFNVKSPIP